MKQADLFTNAAHTSGFLAERARDEGMARSVARADRVEPTWSSDALRFLTAFARIHDAFIGEEVVEAARDVISAPPDSRAWGSVFQTASRRGIIHKTGQFRPARSSNLSPKPVWRAGAR